MYTIHIFYHNNLNKYWESKFVYRFCLVRNRTPPIVVLRSPNKGKARFLWSHCGLRQCPNLYYDVGEMKYLYMYLYRENGVHFIDNYLYHVAWQGVNS